MRFSTNGRGGVVDRALGGRGPVHTAKRPRGHLHAPPRQKGSLLISPCAKWAPCMQSPKAGRGGTRPSTNRRQRQAGWRGEQTSAGQAARPFRGRRGKGPQNGQQRCPERWGGSEEETSERQKENDFSQDFPRDKGNSSGKYSSWLKEIEENRELFFF